MQSSKLANSRIFSHENLAGADLIVDAIYQGGTGKGLSGAVIHKLIPGLGNVGGFRFVGSASNTPLVILFANGGDPNWPDTLDEYLGTFQYYGDNRKPGTELHDTPRKGNQILRRSFEHAHGNSDSRSLTPVFLIFEGTGAGHSVIFRGLAVPGDPYRNHLDDLVAVWRVANGVRFQNYKATFSILDIGHVDGGWIRDVATQSVKPYEDSRCPKVLSEWVRTGIPKVLQAEAQKIGRSPLEQQPESEIEKSLLNEIRSFCKKDDFLFESIAAEIFKLSTPLSMSLDLTRRYRDGGRDAIGKINLGPKSDPISIVFCLEAKHYGQSNSVGVKELSRLISRLKHRDFGVLVTTSFVSKQAYDEIRNDGHPIIILSAKDISTILISRGISTPKAVNDWMKGLTIN